MTMFPVRVVIESVKSENCITCTTSGSPLIDTYAVISTNTPLSQLTDSILSALGYTNLINSSRGLVQISNWKPLTFESICDNPEEKIGDLIKDFANNVTLKIITKRTSVDLDVESCIKDVKQKILKYSLDKQPQILNSISNYQIKEVISQICSGSDPTLLTKEQMQNLVEWADGLQNICPIDEERKSNDSPFRFHHLHEIPKLERWFKCDPNPSKHKLNTYLNELNNSQYRQKGHKITQSQLSNWFTTKRANHKTKQTAEVNLHNFFQGFHALAGLTNIGMNDFKNDANTSNPFSTLLLDNDRIDGGSDSPTPEDDGSEHSASNTGITDIDQAKTESTSPDITLDVSNSFNTSSPKPRPSPGFQSLLNLQASGGSLNSLNPGIKGEILTALQMAATVSNVNNNHTTTNNNSNSQNTTARSRLMFDPLSELPVLEKWFEENPHPGWLQIERYTDYLNNAPYRANYPPVSTHNVKIWFKNRRAKCKRMQTNDTNNSHSTSNILSENNITSILYS
uniref:Homeobox domain-containing protein n=1 Tax=Strongyloides stercoralis TaxID=6248 RepID=A0A0K0ER28_STRER